MTRRVAFIVVWTAAFFLAAATISYLLALALFSVLDRESTELAIMFLAPVLFVLISVLTLMGAVLGIFGLLPGTGKTTTKDE